MPSIIQAAFFIEALVNIPAIVSLLFYPEPTIRPALAANVSLPAAELNRTATFLARCAGVLILALTPQLLLALPDSKDCAGKRKLVYVRQSWSSLFLFEILPCPRFLPESQCMLHERSTHSTTQFTSNSTSLITRTLFYDREY